MKALSLTDGDFAGLAKEVLRRGDKIMFRVQGSSMFPFIRKADLLVAARVPVREIRTGDILLYVRKDGKVVAHRVLARNRFAHGFKFHTRGDAHSDSKEEVSTAQILGIIVEVRRNGRRIHMDSSFRKALALAWAKSQPVGRLLIDCLHWTLIRLPRRAAGKRQT